MRRTNIISIRSLLFFILCSFSDLVAQTNSIQADTLLARQWLKKEKIAFEKGAYQEAFDATEQAQALYAQHQLWEPAVKYATYLAALADNFDDPEIKVRQAQSALNLALLHLPKNDLLVASAYRQKAEALMLYSHLDSANYFLTLAIPIFQKSKGWENLGWSEVLLGVNYINQGQLDSCHLHLQKAQGLLTEQLIPQESQGDMESTILNLLGIVYESQGDVDRAIKNTQQALALDLKKTQLSGVDSSFISIHYNNLGAFYALKGDHEQALDNYIQAMLSYKNALYDSNLLNNIGESLIKYGRFEEAIDYFQKSLESIDGDANQLKARINALIGLSRSYKTLDLDDKANQYARQVIDLPSAYRKFVAWSILGNVLIKKESIDEALRCYDRASTAYAEDSIGFNQSTFFLSRLDWLKGNAYFLKQEPIAALDFYQSALCRNHASFKDRLNHESNPSLTGVLEPIYFLETIHAKAKTLASLVHQENKQKVALETYQLCIQWIDTLQVDYTTETAQLNWSAEFKTIYEEAIQLAFRLYDRSQDKQYVDFAFAISEKSKNAILLETLKSNEGKSLANVPRHLIEKEKTLNRDIAFYEKTLQKARTAKESAKEKLYQEYLSKTRLELVALKEQLERDYPTFQEWKYGGEPISIAVVQSKLLNEQNVFIEYFIGDSTAFVFVITKNEAKLLALDAPAQIENKVADFREVLLDPVAFQQNTQVAFSNYYQKAHDLYQQLLATPISTFSSNIEQLIVVPDGVLNVIPFEALCKAMKNQQTTDFTLLPYLLYDYQLHYTYSGDLLLKNKEQRKRLPANTTCLAYAPSYDGEEKVVQRGGLGQLRSAKGQLEGTASEIQQIARFVEGEFDFGTTATERQFKALASQFGILHLAMHGAIDLKNPKFNHLKFSNINRDSIEDNLLHHYEIANMDLQAQLAVLSACETGVGKYEKGEGVFSLARSFMYAGVPSVVMSLWKVSDASTSQLMPYFYEHLANGQSKDLALQQAKVRFLKEVDVEFHHPFYWSAFVVMGDAQSLKTNSMSWLWWCGMGGMFLGGLTWLYRRKNIFLNKTKELG